MNHSVPADVLGVFRSVGNSVGKLALPSRNQ